MHVFHPHGGDTAQIVPRNRGIGLIAGRADQLIVGRRLRDNEQAESKRGTKHGPHSALL